MDLNQLTAYIAPDYIQKVEAPFRYDYLDIRLIYGVETVFVDYCIYMGSLHGIAEESYKDKKIGLITMDNPGELCGKVDYIQLKTNVNELALYEELRDFWTHNNIGNIVSVLSGIFSSRNLHHIIDQISRIMNNPVVLVDYHSKLMASSCDCEIDDPDIKYLLEHGEFSSEFVKTTRRTELTKMVLTNVTPVFIEPDGVQTIHRRLTGMIWVKQKTQAMITVLEYNRKFTILDSNILGNICSIMAQQLEKQEYNRNPNIISLMYENYLSALLNGENYDLTWVPAWLSYKKWENYQNFHVAMVENSNILHNRAQLLDLTEKIKKQMGRRCVFLLEKKIIILINVENRKDFFDVYTILENIIGDYGLQVGISKRFREISQLQEHCLQAEKAIHMAKILNFPQTIHLFDWQTIYQLLVATENEEGKLIRYKDYRLTILENYDKNHGTDYYRTLYVYLECACNRAKAAKKLFINRNTMDYRMNKIREMLELNDSDGEECFSLYLGYKVEEIEKSKNSQKNK